MIRTYPNNIFRYFLDQISLDFLLWTIYSSTHKQHFMIPNQQNPYYEHDDITIENNLGIDSCRDQNIGIPSVTNIIKCFYHMVCPIKTTRNSTSVFLGAPSHLWRSQSL